MKRDLHRCGKETFISMITRPVKHGKETCMDMEKRISCKYEKETIDMHEALSDSAEAKEMCKNVKETCKRKK